ncbi:hypothetical protein Vadar_005540 [Vaccinium darrowii]|uniref:Uncharacterized protein n=1 Tax=Vaccinium darrowii TaxID=229202 RepID=A0ACB7ZH55_9ERIC|nr:hypothetical protein Vadar_005540 [Vaccinium darrowii]
MDKTGNEVDLGIDVTNFRQVINITRKLHKADFPIPNLISTPPSLSVTSLQISSTMKQLHKQSTTTHQRRDEEIPTTTPSHPYSPKSQKHPYSTRSLPRSLSYLLKEQRLLFILIGILIGATFFILQPILSHLAPSEDPTRHSSYVPELYSYTNRESVSKPYRNWGSGRVPAGVGRKRLRIVVTGGAGFVGSHLVDKLLRRGDDVIVIDNFFTGRKENVMHHFGDPRFELVRHDVVEPILLEVDQIYHLACPASPVHYKYNPVKTIISLLGFVIFLSFSESHWWFSVLCFYCISAFTAH